MEINIRVDTSEMKTLEQWNALLYLTGFPVPKQEEPQEQHDTSVKVNAGSGKPPQKRTHSRKKFRGAKLNKAIVEYLTTRDHPVTIKELKRQFKVSSGTLSVHLAELTEAKVTDHTASKRNRLYFMRKS